MIEQRVVDENASHLFWIDKKVIIGDDIRLTTGNFMCRNPLFSFFELKIYWELRMNAILTNKNRKVLLVKF